MVAEREDTEFQHTYPCPRPPGIEASGGWCLLAGHWRVTDHRLSDRIIPDGVLIHCRAGAGSLTLGGARWTIEPGDVFFCPPGIPHGYACDRRRGWEIRWVHFAGEAAAALCGKAGFGLRSPVRRTAAESAAARRFGDLIRTIAAAGPASGWDAAGDLHRLLLEFVRLASPAPTDGSLASLLDDGARSLAELARRAGYSKYHYCRQFKAETGRSPWRFLTERRLDAGAKLLLETRLSVKEIAAAIGFRNPDYFARLFRERNGVSPREFRGGDGGPAAG